MCFKFYYILSLSILLVTVYCQGKTSTNPVTVINVYPLPKAELKLKEDQPNSNEELSNYDSKEEKDFTTKKVTQKHFYKTGNYKDILSNLEDNNINLVWNEKDEKLPEPAFTNLWEKSNFYKKDDESKLNYQNSNRDYLKILSQLRKRNEKSDNSQPSIVTKKENHQVHNVFIPFPQFSNQIPKNNIHENIITDVQKNVESSVVPFSTDAHENKNEQGKENIDKKKRREENAIDDLIKDYFIMKKLKKFKKKKYNKNDLEIMDLIKASKGKNKKKEKSKKRHSNQEKDKKKKMEALEEKILILDLMNLLMNDD